MFPYTLVTNVLAQPVHCSAWQQRLNALHLHR